MNRAFNARLTKMEALGGLELSERAKAWLGLRGALTAEEEATEPVVEANLSGLSAEVREWLSWPSEKPPPSREA